MRIIGTLVILLGLAVLVLGIVLMTQASTARNEVADSIAPLPLDQLDDQYDAVTEQYKQMKAAGAQPDVQFNNLYATKTGLGLARANVGKARMLNWNGIIDIIAGAGLVLAGLGLLRKAKA
jgi:uncharacterized membrane protein